MSEGGGIGGVLLGVAIGYFIWGNEPAYIDNLKASAEGEPFNQTWVLAKTTFGFYDQIALVHGLVDDAHGCETFRAAIAREGGDWICVPASAITGGKPWWEFW